MKKHVCLIGLAATLVLTLVPAVHAESDLFRFRGRMTDATFVTPASGGCIGTIAELYFFEDRFTGPAESQEQGENRSYVAIAVGRFDECESTFYTDITGFALVPADAYSFNGLQTARLKTSFEAYDFVNGTAVPVTIDLTWEGIGDAFHTMTSDRSTFPHYRQMIRAKGTTRQATATGTFLVGTVNVASGPSESGSVRSNQLGTVTSYR